MSGTLIVKYRPLFIEEIAGHQDVIAALKLAFEAPTRPHGYLMTGPSGVGKTTIARIIAGWLAADVVEIDAATHSGVDAMRELNENANYIPLTAAVRMIIIDECHALSKAAWQAILKLLEEPPDHLYFALCTTERDKVPATIRNQRCYPVELKRVNSKDIQDLLHDVCKLEKWQVDDEVLSSVIAVSNGSPRKALTFLQSVHFAKNKDEASRIIRLNDMRDEDASPLLVLCRGLLAHQADWKVFRDALDYLEESDEFDSGLSAVAGYMSSVMVGKDPRTNKPTDAVTAKRAWDILDAVMFPTAGFDPRASFCCAIGRVYWQLGGVDSKERDSKNGR